MNDIIQKVLLSPAQRDGNAIAALASQAIGKLDPWNSADIVYSK